MSQHYHRRSTSNNSSLRNRESSFIDDSSDKSGYSTSKHKLTKAEALKKAILDKFDEKRREYVTESTYVQLILKKQKYINAIVLQSYRFDKDRDLYVAYPPRKDTLSKLEVYQHVRHLFIEQNRFPFFYTKKDEEPHFFTTFENEKKNSKKRIFKENSEEFLLYKLLESTNELDLLDELYAAEKIRDQTAYYEMARLAEYKDYTPLEMAAFYVADVRHFHFSKKKPTYEEFYTEAKNHLSETTKLWTSKYFPFKMPLYFKQMVRNVERGALPYDGLLAQKKQDDKALEKGFFEWREKFLNPRYNMNDTNEKSSISNADEEAEEEEAESEGASEFSEELPDDELEVLYIPRLPPGPRRLKDLYGNYIDLSLRKKEQKENRGGLNNKSIIMNSESVNNSSHSSSRISTTDDNSRSVSIERDRILHNHGDKEDALQSKSITVQFDNSDLTLAGHHGLYEKNESSDHLQFSCEDCVYKKVGENNSYYIHGRAIMIPSSSSAKKTSSSLAKNIIYVPSSKAPSQKKKQKRKNTKQKEDSADLPEAAIQKLTSCSSLLDIYKKNPSKQNLTRLRQQCATLQYLNSSSLTPHRKKIVVFLYKRAVDSSLRPLVTAVDPRLSILSQSNI